MSVVVYGGHEKACMSVVMQKHNRAYHVCLSWASSQLAWNLIRVTMTLFNRQKDRLFCKKCEKPIDVHEHVWVSSSKRYYCESCYEQLWI